MTARSLRSNSAQSGYLSRASRSLFDEMACGMD
jgi:hypothetical protein